MEIWIQGDFFSLFFSGWQTHETSLESSIRNSFRGFWKLHMGMESRQKWIYFKILIQKPRLWAFKEKLISLSWLGMGDIPKMWTIFLLEFSHSCLMTQDKLQQRSLGFSLSPSCCLSCKKAQKWSPFYYLLMSLDFHPTMFQSVDGLTYCYLVSHEHHSPHASIQEIKGNPLT